MKPLRHARKWIIGNRAYAAELHETATRSTPVAQFNLISLAAKSR